jgi:hypothetical protein
VKSAAPWFIAVAMVSGCAPAASKSNAFEANIPLHPITAEPATISFHFERGMSASSQEPEPEDLPLVAAIWPDGQILWSADRVSGGSPYSAARVTTSEVAELVEHLRAWIEECPAESRSYRIPDAAHQELTLLEGDRLSGLASCIDLFEIQPNLVATDHGIEGLEGRDRSTIVTAQSQAHRDLRRTWKRCVDAVLATIPPGGKPSPHPAFVYVHWSAQEGRQWTIPR